MSNNCVKCIKSKRTGSDLLCDSCRREPTVQIQARCMACKHKWTMSSQEIEDANAIGMASRPKCYSPATVEGASIE